MLRAAAILALPMLAGGCVAAAIPVLASGVIARDRVLDRNTSVTTEPVATPSPMPATATSGEPLADTGRSIPDLEALMQSGPPRATDESALSTVSTPSTDTPGAGEAAAYSLQAYQALWNHLAAQIAVRKQGGVVRSVVLAAGATLDAPRYIPCDQRPLAVIFDLDENAGLPDPKTRWQRWRGDGSDNLAAVPGAVEGVEAARREGVAVIFTSGRLQTESAGVVALLDRLGFGQVTPGTTLILRADDNGSRSGDTVRQEVAATHCVIALVGDSLGEFSDLFDKPGNIARRPTAATETMVAPLWGAGWFLLPNPVRSVAASGDASKGVN